MRKTLLVLALIMSPSLALAQAQTSLASLRVGYSTRKATVKPQGELKAQIDAIDRELAEATRSGRTGEIRRLLAKGTTLLTGRAWTPELDFTTSLVIRTEAVVVDSERPWPIRVEQIYAPANVLERPLTAKVLLRQRPVAAASGQAAQPGAIVKDLGSFDGVARDLRDAPFEAELPVSGVADGPYQLTIDLADGERPLGTVASSARSD